MASPGNNNSSSSPPIPNRPNPKPRNSEAADSMRRSFGGNPFPANSKVNTPSDFSRRNTFGSDKENETKAFPSPKSTKNFMSPTISAVSKINASPRKRVLSDRNEVSRSVSFSEDTKSHHHQAKSCVSFSDVIHVIGIDDKKQFEESHDMTITDFDEKEVYENKGIAYSDPRFRISPRPSVPYTSPEFAAPEVGPMLPPYDPKKNYLSPRPQFLHYRLNPRIEQRFDECKQLDELFTSESSSSDTELSVEESEKCEEDCHEGGAETAVEEETEDVEQLEAESDEEMVCEGIEETSQVPKQSGFRKFKFLGWLLALALGYLLVSATFTSPTELLKESSLYEFHIPREITEFAEANNLEQLSEKLWTLTASSLVYMDKLISRLGGEEEYGPFQFHNLTDILEDYTVFQPTDVEISVAELDHQEPEEPLQEKSQGENNLEDGYESVEISVAELDNQEPEAPLQEKSKGGNILEDVSVNEFEDTGGAEETTEVVCETKDEFEEQTEMKLGTDIELNDGKRNLEALFEDGLEWNNEEQKYSEVIPEVNNDARGSESQESLETETGSTKKDQEDLEEAESKARGNESQGKLETGSTKKDQDELEKAESEAIYINQHDVESAAINVQQQFQSVESESEEGFGEIAAETSDDIHPKLDSDLAKAMIVALSSTVLGILAAVAFLYSKKAKPVAASAPEQASETTKKLNSGHVTVENLMKEKVSSLNFEEEVDDRISNSFHKKSSFHSNNRDSKEHHSSSKLRRESMASSASEYSVGSFSYGSFTTYEKIPIKSGDKEEEMITPVRRSSRLRNHHQSSSGL